jgi:hypothetical protein
MDPQWKSLHPMCSWFGYGIEVMIFNFNSNLFIFYESTEYQNFEHRTSQENITYIQQLLV